MITPESDSEVGVHAQLFTAHVRLLGVHAVLECIQHRDITNINLPSYANAFAQSITTLDNRARPIARARRRLYTAGHTRCAKGFCRVYIHTLIEMFIFTLRKNTICANGCRAHSLLVCFVKQLMANYDPFAHPGVGLYMPACAKRNECEPVSMI